MKLNYKVQLILTVIVFVAFYILTILFGHWIFRSIGLCICGLMYTIHPVVSEKDTDNKDVKKFVRIAGIVLILAGIFTRV